VHQAGGRFMSGKCKMIKLVLESFSSQHSKLPCQRMIRNPTWPSYLIKSGCAERQHLQHRDLHERGPWPPHNYVSIHPHLPWSYNYYDFSLNSMKICSTSLSSRTRILSVKSKAFSLPTKFVNCDSHVLVPSFAVY